MAQANQVLKIRGLFQVRPVRRETEREWSVRIELRGIGDVVAETFVQGEVVGFQSRLEFMPAMADDEVGFKIAFAKAIVLKDLDRRGARVGVEIIGIVSNHSFEVGQHIGRKRVLV
jgi:hypothetical protein